MRGDSPVLGAAVKMDIKVELNNGSVLAVTNSSMDLVDNGLGGLYNPILLKYFGELSIDILRPLFTD